MARTALQTAYLYHRTYHLRPSVALQRARNDIETGKTRSIPFKGSGIGGNSGDSGLRWVERPGAIGLRWVGWSDEIARREGYSRAIDHTGRFTDSTFQEEVYRGCVYQLPARNGKPLYLAAYREGYESRKSGWQDSAYGFDHGAARIEFPSNVASQLVALDSPWEAARHADSIAESEAETAREYNDAWCAANQWYELGESMQVKRREARQLVRDMREAIKSGIGAAPSICNALRAQLRRLLEEWEAMRKEREELDSNFYYRESGKRVGIAEFAESNC